jgi:hypothetical protein
MSEHDPDDGASEGDDGPDPAVPEGADLATGNDADPPAGDGEGVVEESSWRFSLEEVGEDGIETPTVEPERIDPEHALFVGLGAVATGLIFLRLWMLVSV